MRVNRPVAFLAMAGVLAATGTASAASKPKPKPIPKVCNLVVDVAGDSATKDDALDILSADIASDAKSFTTVIRVKNASASGLNQFGSILRMQFDLAGAEAPVWMGYSNSAYGGKAFQYGLIGKGTGGSTSPTGDAVGVVDTAKNEIRISVATSAMNGLGKAKPGDKVTNLAVSASQMVGLAPNPTGTYAHATEDADDATGKNYTAGAPSCVTPGA